MTASPAAERVGDFLRTTTQSGLAVYLLQTRKFKTRSVEVHLHRPLDERSPARTLLATLLSHGTQRHPSLRELSSALRSLYGSSASVSTHRAGTSQALTARMACVDERALPGRPAVLTPVMGLLRDLVLESAWTTRTLRDGTFEQERTNQRREVEALRSDKPSWAHRRFVEEWFAGEVHARSLLGSTEEIDALDVATLDDTWNDLRRAPARVIAVGDLEPEALIDWASTLGLDGAEEPPATAQARRPDRPMRTLVEEDDMSQSRLSIGCDVDVADAVPATLDALRIATSILGGGFHSRLFRTVRETHGLAYDISAAFDVTRGALMIDAGVDADQRERVTDLVRETLASMHRDGVTDEEFEPARRLLWSSVRTAVDAPSMMAARLEHGLQRGMVRPVAEASATLERMTRKDVEIAWERVGSPVLAYCLTGNNRAT